MIPAFFSGAGGHGVRARSDAWCLHRSGQERELRRSAAHGAIPTAVS
jgi:hypothetical protein